MGASALSGFGVEWGGRGGVVERFLKEMALLLKRSICSYPVSALEICHDLSMLQGCLRLLEGSRSNGLRPIRVGSGRLLALSAWLSEAWPRAAKTTPLRMYLSDISGDWT